MWCEEWETSPIAGAGTGQDRLGPDADEGGQSPRATQGTVLLCLSSAADTYCKRENLPVCMKMVGPESDGQISKISFCFL